MQNVMPESLLNIKNDWMKIWRENSAGNVLHVEEMNMATYLRALELDCFNLYKPRLVYVPKGWMEAYSEYQTVLPENKSKIWKGICEKFSGYIKARNEASAENDSSKSFLKDMMNYFESKNMPGQAEKCRQRLLEFESALVAA